MRNSIRVEEIAKSESHLCDHCQARPATGIRLDDGSHICPDCCPEQVAQAWDDERGYPWPYQYRPCFGCGAVATAIYHNMPLCGECEEDIISEEQEKNEIT